ncbi:sulfide/dihydroorotate dehydrogenase-like FAD/NAD-binding protein [Hippea maritima]|uniref:Oxidoreductase FAD/NAD(P)-binding domain protein n=1 Tax=Hippea maritima (strain ATCC 700847 / DSM 10411 / MH2) TaxID=760142 RepID=F2LXM1_HIPMA|nr:sulfide/dihydroorotate dehydrogenase-like FAD/NAD-binding protein [Hippea maritima]AEA33207.1 oxidoreductase FAD/NAD(P)-binding domain protein [Hippea maritima DSM 10411]
MARILKKEQWSDTIFSMLIEAKDVAKASKAGQFIILIPKEHGERVPLTIADSSKDEGWVQIVFQVVGKSTLELSRMNEGDELYSFVGPLGMPSEVEKFSGKVIMIGGGIGIAPIHPIAKTLKDLGNHVVSIIGARTADLLIMEDKMKEASTELIVATDDGSKGKKGFVNMVLEELLATEADNVDRIWAIGPPIMMKACTESAKKFNKPIIVSLNPIMVDGTGMCGACRVTVGGKTKFACVDGPEFDGALVDFDELMARQRQYKEQEQKALELYKAKEGLA